jgi:hypothetical protein
MLLTYFVHFISLLTRPPTLVFLSSCLARPSTSLLLRPLSSSSSFCLTPAITSYLPKALSFSHQFLHFTHDLIHRRLRRASARHTIHGPSSRFGACVAVNPLVRIFEITFYVHQQLHDLQLPVSSRQMKGSQPFVVPSDQSCMTCNKTHMFTSHVSTAQTP